MPSEVSIAGADQDLGRRVEELERELVEARAEQAATSEILRVISISPADAQPVFDAIVSSAVRLLRGNASSITRIEGNQIALAAMTSTDAAGNAAQRARFPLPLDSEEDHAQVTRTRATFNITDAHVDPRLPETQRASARIRGYQSLVVVPLLRHDDVVGTLGVSRREPGGFTDDQISVLQTFAGQAVIAIENTRLFEEVQTRTRDVAEALEYQTATGDVLNVISRSPLDVQPVFDAIAQSAAQLCEAQFCHVFRYDGELIHFAASHGQPREISEAIRSAFYPIAPGRASAAARSVLSGAVEEIPDIRNDEDYEHHGLAKYRSIVAVPMLKVGRPIGAIAVARPETGRFPERQVELLRTFADQAVIAIENTRLFEAEQASKRELQESLEYQTGVSDVLSVISRSKFELQPVIDTIVETATRLCEAERGAFLRFEEEGFRLVPTTGSVPGPISSGMLGRLIPFDQGSIAGRVALNGSTVHVHDMQADPEITLMRDTVGDTRRTALGVPLLGVGGPIGAIVLQRTVVKPFTDRQIKLVKTFADQAVIAVENTRLFEAEQARTKQLQETLEYQSATADVLNVISRSPTNVQPVFDMIAQSAARLCKAKFCRVYQFDGQLIHFAATHGLPIPSRPSFPPGRGFAVPRSILNNSVEEIPDVYADADYAQLDVAAVEDFRSVVAVPMRKDGYAVGTIAVARPQAGRFPEQQIELLKTFADQAVIAIENTRLFEEVQARTRDLTEALQQQTATADVLKVISRSTFDLGPVLETLVENATRLAVAEAGLLTRFDGEVFRVVAGYGASPEVSEYWRRNVIHPGRGSPIGRAGLERQTVHIVDLLADPEYELREAQRLHGGRSVLGVPMLRQNDLIGVFFLYRTTVRAFTDKQIELVTTFAEQAVIAIENTRLFEEVQARNRDLTALGEVGRAVSSTLDLKVVLKTIVNRAVDLSGTDGGSIFYYREAVGRFELGETTGLDEEVVAKFRKLDISTGETGLGEAITQRQPLQIPDIIKRPSNPLRDSALEAGLRAALIVPLLGGERPLGALVLQRRQPGEFSEAVVSLMQTFADQSAIALENAGLFEEIAQKSRELEIASQHKSQFVANMSHELRTPLAAILGYAELMQEGFYEPQGDKSMAALTRIRSNGKHLLGLINTVLDIAKIESGQFSLNLSEYAIENVVETVRSATESLAETKKLALKTDVAKKLPIGLGDEQRLTQVLLNLVGNAIKFTDTGEVRITAMAMNGHFTVAVTDTGPGIPAEELNRVFEQFHQIDNSNTKAKGGTGLGLAIAKQIVEMHGGRIWVESTLGQGATFQMELPVRAAAAKGAA